MPPSLPGPPMDFVVAKSSTQNFCSIVDDFHYERNARTDWNERMKSHCITSRLSRLIRRVTFKYANRQQLLARAAERPVRACVRD